MVYQLYEFYKKELSIYSRVFKHMKFWYYTFILSPIIAGIVVMVISIHNRNFSGKGFIISIIIAMLFASIPFNCYAKQTVSKLYGVCSDGYMWNSLKVINALRKNRKEKLYEYIQEIDSDIDADDIKKLSLLALSEAENLKIKFPLIPSVFAALFISLWNNFISWIYRYENIQLFEDAFRVFSFISILLLMIIGLLIMIKSFLNIIVDDIINKDSKTMKRLSELLSEVHDDKVRQEIRSN